LDPIIPSYSWDSDSKEERKCNPKNTNEQQLFLETKNGKIRSNGKLSIPGAEEG
jgi:hypothetical protein